MDLRLRYNTAKLATIQSMFQMYYTEPGVVSAPSKSTLSRIMAKAHITRKITTARHMRADPQAQLAFLDSIAHIDPHRMIDVDETLCTAAEFHEKYGWSPEGQPAYYQQIVIGGVAYSTVAAYSVLGFVCWAVYAGSVTSMEMQDFVLNDLQPYINEHTHVVLDNATIHKTEEVRGALAATLGDRYTYSAPYSPQLKPIELGFANIKRWIRDHEADAVGDPISWINLAFHVYSMQGERSAAGKSLYNIICKTCKCNTNYWYCYFLLVLTQRPDIGAGIFKTISSTSSTEVSTVSLVTRAARMVTVNLKWTSTSLM